MSLHARSKELREERYRVVNEARAILANTDVCEPERRAKFDELMATADELKADIDRVERALAAEAELEARRELRADREGTSVDEAATRAAFEADTFRAWMRGGLAALSPEQAEHVRGRLAPLPGIQAAQTTGTPASGGYLVPQDFANRIDEALKAYGGMLEVAEILDTGTGATLPYPTENDTANKGAIIGENTQITTVTDLAFGNINLAAFMYTSNIVLVPFQLMQDSFVDIDSLVARKLGTRIARIWNEHFTTGAGTTEPKGIVTAATTQAAAAAAAISYVDLVTLEHSVEPSYRKGAKFMMADSTIKALKLLTSSGDDRPLWVPGIAVREPDTILGYPYVINQDMAAIGASAKSVVFGALGKYLIRRVLGYQMLRLTERYADYLQVGFIGYARADGNLIDAGTHPVKVLTHPGT